MLAAGKQTFDEVIREHAPDAATRDRILSNRIYQQLSSALAGSQEYMAMEKLFELHTEGRFDLIADLAEFFNAFSGMVDGFQARAKRVNKLLAAPTTCFLVVCGPQGEPIDEAVYFHRKLVEAKLPFGGVIVNKVHYPAEDLRGEVEDLPATLAEKLGDEDLARRVAANFSDYQALAQRDARNIEHLAREMRATGVIRVPYLDEDVHDLAGLAQINRYLFATGEERVAMAAGRA